ncbi:MAG: hypothetical protein LAT55_12185, partial [Opitutales bacterium]|nr:hypothetical protein [Opitutales bacterium]
MIGNVVMGNAFPDGPWKPLAGAQISTGGASQAKALPNPRCGGGLTSEGVYLPNESVGNFRTFDNFPRRCQPSPNREVLPAEDRGVKPLR